MKKWTQLPVARVKRLLALCAAAALVAACGTTPTAPRWQGETPGSLLWVGNSFFYFNNSMHGHLGGLLNALALAAFILNTIAAVIRGKLKPRSCG